jgi:peroxiredoxin
MAHSQTPEALLNQAAAAYGDPNGYEINGHGWGQLPDSDWRIPFNVVLAAAPSPLETPRKSAVPSGRVHPLKPVNLKGDEEGKPQSYGVPFAVVSFWTAIADNVVSVREVGADNMPLNGTPQSCRVLEVEYRSTEDIKRFPATYWICGERHLVLKKTMTYGTGRRAEDSPAMWTVVFDTAAFNRPAPDWLVGMKDIPKVQVRREWIGKAAPVFKLPDLEGKPVELTSLRGKPVLLDFWSVTCAPCVRGLPVMAALELEYRGALQTWGISFDTQTRVKKWQAEHGPALPTLLDAEFSVSDAFKVNGIPAVVLIDRDGVVRNYWQGEVPEKELRAAIGKVARK